MKSGYKMIKEQLMQLQVENEFYRNNFRELVQVPAARKMRYYLKHYDKKLPKLESQVHEKSNLIEYWKQWYGKSAEKWGVMERRLLDT